MKKYFVVLFMMLFLLLTGCVEPSNKKVPLESVSLSYNDMILTWTEVENAEYYEIYVDNHLYETTNELTINLNKLNAF